MGRIQWAGCLAIASLALPAAASAHGGHGHGARPSRLDAGERHAATDLAGVSVTTLERRVRAATRRLGRQPGTARRSARAAQAPANPGTEGSWSSVQNVAVVPIFTALLPNGKILMWDSVGDAPAESYDNHTFTRAAVFDPATRTSKDVSVSGYNIFCAGFVQLANGNVFVAGGNADRNLSGIRQTHVFDWRTETWSRGPDMQDGRWYPSVAALPNDEAVIVGGGPTTAEVRTTGGALRRLTGFTTPSSREYPFLQAATDGRAVVLGGAPAMSLLTTDGMGSLSSFGNRDGIYRSYGSYAPYDIGRFLVSGGGSVTEDGSSGVPSRTASVVDTRSDAPVGQATGSMQRRRRQHNLTTLADGSVLATGGQSTNNGGGLVDLNNPVLAAERWDPATGAWSLLASAAVARQYHSIALLLPDATVATGGGGICGVCQQVGYLRKDMEFFTPPYLYKRDGSGLAARPEITSAPGAIAYDTPFSVGATVAAPATRIAKAGLVRLGAPTHGEDQGQRYVPLTFSASGTSLTLTGPNNPNEAPAGYYMLFLVDDQGVPSVAKILQLNRSVAPPAPVAVNLALGRPATGTAACRSSEGPEKAVNGSVSGGLSDKFCSKVTGNRTLRIDLGGSKPVSRFVVKHAGAGGESTAMNTRNYRIETRLAGGSWSTAATVTANTASVTTTTATARQARYVRLVITASEQGSGAGAARVYELEVYGSSGAVAPLAPVVAYANADATGRAQRFEAGGYDVGRGNLGLIGDDGARAIDVAPGFQATVCRDTGLSGCTTLGPGRAAPLPAGYDAAISSMRVVRTP